MFSLIDTFSIINRSKLVFLLCVMCCAGLLGIFQGNALLAIYSNQGYEPERTMPPAVLTAMAVDMVHGVFYRPLVSPDGYGGTRYMPLYFILQAALINVGFSPMAASWAMAIISLTLLLAGVYYVLSQLKVEPILIAGGTLFVLLSFITQHVFSSMRPDTLAAALNIAGIGLAIRLHNSSRNRLLWSSAMILCFTLAFLTKVSMIFGFLAVILFFLGNGKRKQAAWAAVCITGVIAVTLLGIQWASEGQFLTSFITTGTANGGIREIVKAPLSWFSHTLSSPASLLIIILAWAGLVSGLTSLSKDLVTLALLLTSLTVVLLFGSPGVSYNHILDLYIIAVVYLIARINNAQLPVKPILAYMAIAAIIATGQQIKALHDKTNYYKQSGKLADVQRILARYQVLSPEQDCRPILADNPWLPLLMGERPYVLDQFMLGVLNKKNPQNLQLFRNQIRQQFFRAVVIENPQVQLFNPEYAEPYMGMELTRELLRSYKIAGNTSLGVVLVRKTNLSISKKPF